MTREEAIEVLDNLPLDVRKCSTKQCGDIGQAIDLAISALRPVSREKVEKAWRGEWISYLDGEHIMPERYYSCSKCGDRGYTSKRNFCDSCGAPMTDEAVQILIERMEELKDGSTTD